MTSLPGTLPAHTSRIVMAIAVSLFVELNEEAHTADRFDVVLNLWNDDSGHFGRQLELRALDVDSVVQFSLNTWIFAHTPGLVEWSLRRL